MTDQPTKKPFLLFADVVPRVHSNCQCVTCLMADRVNAVLIDAVAPICDNLDQSEVTTVAEGVGVPEKLPEHLKAAFVVYAMSLSTLIASGLAGALIDIEDLEGIVGVGVRHAAELIDNGKHIRDEDAPARGLMH